MKTHTNIRVMVTSVHRKRLLDFIEPDAQSAFGDRIQRLAGTCKVKGGLRVSVGFSGLQKQRGAGAFQFVEWTQRLCAGLGRAIVVGVYFIARKWVHILPPLRIHKWPLLAVAIGR